MELAIFFSGWPSLVRAAIVGVLAYVALVLFLRISGKRTLSKLNAFDLVVTVSLGSTLATILLNKEVALAEGVLVFAVLIGLQYSVAWLSVRSPFIRKIVKSEPRLLLHHGEFLEGALTIERITREEVEAAVRRAGFSCVDATEAVVLETDGNLSVIGAPRSSGSTGFPVTDICPRLDRSELPQAGHGSTDNFTTARR